MAKQHLNIGEFIVEKLSIPPKEVRKFLNMQEYLNEKIGEMAIRKKFIEKKELKKILDFQKKHKISFGNAAIYLGRMKNAQVKYLLDIQAREKHRIGELLVQKGTVSQKDFMKVIEEFYSKKQARFTILALVRDSISQRLAEAVKPYNYQFHTWSSEEEMERLLKKLTPQLIFLDQHMGDPLENAVKIKHLVASSPVKIALLSSGEREMEALGGYEYGIDYVLPIPFDQKHLINIMIDTEVQTGEKRKERILVVDDSSIVRDSVAEELEESGFQSIFAENGKEAVKIAQLEEPDLILMDINMPVMNGYEACRELKKGAATNHIPIIILTTGNTREERERGFKAGATEYFTKPFSKGHLSGYIKHLLSGKKGIRSESILVAEDALLHQKIYESILNKYGFQFRIVENGKQVFEALKEGAKPLAIILDCDMPVMNGFDACRRLKKDADYASIPVIMVTASDKKEDVVKGMNAGADDYIFKPFDSEELVNRLEGHVKNFLLVKKLREEQRILQQDTDRLRSAFEKAATGMALVTPDGRWLQANHSLCDIIGYSGEELQSMTFQDLVHPDDLKNYLASHRRLQDGKVPQFDLEIKFTHKRKHVFWVQLDVSLVRDADDVPLYLIFQIQDITQRKKSEEERTRLALAVEQTADSILITDTDGVIRYVNPGFEQNTGYEANEVIGQNPRILKSGKHDDAFYREMWDQLIQGNVWRGRLINKKKNGTFFEEDASISPIVNSNGKILNYIGVKRDVTHEVLLERQFRQSQKMQAIGTLAGGIAHDFNNILTGIIGYSELTIEELPQDSKIRDHVNMVLKAGKRARDLVSQILAFSRKAAQERMPTQFHLILKEVLNLLRATLPASIEIREQITMESDMVRIDPTQMHQVVMNLCANASHAMDEEEGGVLEAILQPFEVDAEFANLHAELNPGKYLRLTISDTGHGIEKQNLDRIFEPFFTTKKTGEGTGLGLSVVHGIVESHEGMITAYSEPGVGTTFHVYLPRWVEKEKEKKSRSIPISKGKERILFVDDEEMIVGLGQRLLDRLGYQVDIKTDSREALKAFRADPEKYDLVITDQAMPHMTGEVLAKKILKLRQDASIILCTGFSARMTPEKAKEIGVREFLMKPYSMDQISHAIRSALKPKKKKRKSVK